MKELTYQKLFSGFDILVFNGNLSFMVFQVSLWTVFFHFLVTGGFVYFQIESLRISVLILIHTLFDYLPAINSSSSKKKKSFSRLVSLNPTTETLWTDRSNFNPPKIDLVWFCRSYNSGANTCLDKNRLFAKLGLPFSFKLDWGTLHCLCC